jgi:hypothetical protein
MFESVSAVADPAAAGPGPLNSADLQALVAQVGNLEHDVTDAERVTQLDTLERVKAACAAAQAAITAAFVDSQHRVAEAWHAQAAECSERGDFEGWRAARDRARDAEFLLDDPSDTGTDVSPGAARRRARQRHSRTGIAAQIGLARRESPARGARLVSTALALTGRLPHTFAALRAGLLNEYRAELVVNHTRHLAPALQTLVDHQVVGAAGPAVAGWGNRELERRVRACADRLDAAAAAARARHAETQRRVTLRPIPDTMAALTALLPVAQAVAVHAALTGAAARAKAAGDPRSKGQIMADTLVALVTGQQVADDLPIEIQVIITDRALLHGDTTPAHIPGYGPVPADWVIDLLTRHTTPDDPVDDPADPRERDELPTEATDFDETDLHDATEDDADADEAPAPEAADLNDRTDHDAGARERPAPREPAAAGTSSGDEQLARTAAVWLRRLYTHPGTGTLVAMDSRRRLFPAGLRRYLTTRDGTCRTPWCNAPIRHADHIHPHARGGPTTAGNGEGLCIRCNLTDNLPGFHTRVTDPGPTSGSPRPHTTELTTPAGHTYTSTAPPVLPLDDPLLRHRPPPGPRLQRRPLPETAITINPQHWHTRPRIIDTPNSPLEQHLAALIAS